MAAGQTINLFRRDKTGKIHLPVDGAVIAPGNRVLRLESGENGSLSGTVMFNSANYSTSSLSITPIIKEANGTAIQSQPQRIRINAGFGPQHYINWRIEFRKAAGPISVSLRVEDDSGIPNADCDFLFVRSEP